MALNNIFKEPRREITESLVGIGVTVVVAPPLIWLDYRAAMWTHPKDGENLASLMLMMPMLAFIALVALFIVAWLTHVLGEGICNWLARRGLELRPKDRK